MIEIETPFNPLFFNEELLRYVICIQDTLSSRARLAECVARAKVSCIQLCYVIVFVGVFGTMVQKYIKWRKFHTLGAFHIFVLNLGE